MAQRMLMPQWTPEPKMSTRAEPCRELLPGDELLAPLPLGAMVLFGLNNWVLKATYGNWATGKLSDVTACFFIPFLISTTMGALGSKRTVSERVRIGAVVTSLVMTMVKTSATASRFLDWVLALPVPAGFESTNTVDPTDLIALPFCVLAVGYASWLEHLAERRAPGW